MNEYNSNNPLNALLEVDFIPIGSPNENTDVDVYVPYLNKKLSVSVPNWIQPEQKLRIKELGYSDSLGNKGDLLIRFINTDLHRTTNNSMQHRNATAQTEQRIISLKCPECGASFEINSDRKTCFCQYCGTQLFFDDGSKTITHRKIDDARIKEAEVKETIELKKIEISEKKREDRKKALKIVALIAGILFALALIVGLFNSNAGYMLGMVAALIILWGYIMIDSSKDNKD